ncbi:hypothetical protein I79_026173 [Cricetulus griseus]|uniref:Uncharacterized protein n=1 Tax=Cricetulus griseus TaxID=10029 RepID=G3IQ76_CRIGR|nr:hypothetical protein I79_026173 [Cricetulus griseus]
MKQLVFCFPLISKKDYLLRSCGIRGRQHAGRDIAGKRAAAISLWVFRKGSLSVHLQGRVGEDVRQFKLRVTNTTENATV